VDAIKEGDDKYYITEDCIECGTCVDICPNGAIVPAEK
jgi:ferredoxin